MTVCVHGIDLTKIDHEVIHDQRTYVRDVEDRRYNIWTDDHDKAVKILKNFKLEVEGFQLPEGKVFAVFFNDNIAQNLTQIIYNKNANSTFADYADSGIKFKLKALEKGKKYSHITVVIFKPINIPRHLGIRDMVRGGLSNRQ